MTNRSAALVTVAVAVGAIGITLGAKPAPRFVWNASESVPTGLYQVQPTHHLIVTMLVVAYPPDPLASFLADRGYLPRGVPLIKRVLALSGQTVCRAGPIITVDGIEMGAARKYDSRRRVLPAWDGCRIVGGGEVFLMNRDEPASLDGRYFGPIPLNAVVGRAVALWTFQKGLIMRPPCQPRRTRLFHLGLARWQLLPPRGVLNNRLGAHHCSSFWLATGPAHLAAPRRMTASSSTASSSSRTQRSHYR